MGAIHIAKRLYHGQRDVLVDHVRQPQPIDNSVNSQAATRRTVMASLERLGLIKPDPAVKRAQHTVLTELGREVVAVVLASYAEALVRAGCLDEIRALDLTPTAIRELRLLTTSASALTESQPSPTMVESSPEEDHVRKTG